MKFFTKLRLSIIMICFGMISTTTAMNQNNNIGNNNPSLIRSIGKGLRNGILAMLTTTGAIKYLHEALDLPALIELCKHNESDLLKIVLGVNTETAVTELCNIAIQYPFPLEVCCVIFALLLAYATVKLGYSSIQHFLDANDWLEQRGYTPLQSFLNLLEEGA